MCLSLESEFSCMVDAKQIQSIAAHDVREVNQSLLKEALKNFPKLKNMSVNGDEVLMYS